MLDYGAEHFKLRHLDMPRNFFGGNNCVAEYGNFPSNFLLGVSTPGNDIQFRRQMRSRLGEPITVAGNPPVKFASASFEAENETHRLPDFLLFLTRVFLFDFFSIGMLPITEGIVFPILYICLLRLGGHPIASAAIALILAEVNLVLFSVAIKKSLVGSEWGADHSTPFWSWRHFAYFFAQDCFFVWCRGPLVFCAGTILSNSILRWMGCQIGHADNRDPANAVLRLERGELRQRLCYRRLPAVSHLREHDAEGEANPHPGRLRRRLRRHGDGRRGH